MGELARKALEAMEKQAEQVIEPMKIEPMPPRKIWSNLLREIIWVVGSVEEMDLLVKRVLTEVIYTADEISSMKQFTPEEVKAVHATKRIFPGAAIMEASCK
jgi:hypothetical protein